MPVPQDGRGDGGAGCCTRRVTGLDEDDTLVGRVKDVKDVEKRLRHRLLPHISAHNAWRLVPFFELFMSEPKDELHQWYVLCCHMYILSYTCI